MHNPVEIVLRGVPLSAELERLIADEAAKLDRLYDRIQTCYVAIEALHLHRRQGAQFAVRLNITLPGKEVVVNREHGEDAGIALRDAFDAAGRQLKDNLRRQGNGRARIRGRTPHSHR